MSNIKMGEFPALLSEEIIDRASKLSTALLCDGMKKMGIPFEGCMDEGINPVDIKMKVVGTACTLSTDSGDNLPIHLALYSAKPGYVMVMDGKKHKEHPYFGDLIVSTAKAVGLKGLVIDGLIRDREGIIDLGFPVFSRGFMQRGPAKNNPGEINYPIVCGGVKVNPGDLVMGDSDGVVSVPVEVLDEVLENAEKKLAYEIERRKSIEEYEQKRLEGEEVFDLTPGWVKEMLSKAE